MTNFSNKNIYKSHQSANRMRECFNKYFTKTLLVFSKFKKCILHCEDPNIFSNFFVCKNGLPEHLNLVAIIFQCISVCFKQVGNVTSSCKFAFFKIFLIALCTEYWKKSGLVSHFSRIIRMFSNIAASSPGLNLLFCPFPYIFSISFKKKAKTSNFKINNKKSLHFPIFV